MKTESESLNCLFACEKRNKIVWDITGSNEQVVLSKYYQLMRKSIYNWIEKVT